MDRGRIGACLIAVMASAAAPCASAGQASGKTDPLLAIRYGMTPAQVERALGSPLDGPVADISAPARDMVRHATTTFHRIVLTGTLRFRRFTARAPGAVRGHLPVPSRWGLYDANFETEPQYGFICQSFVPLLSDVFGPAKASVALIGDDDAELPYKATGQVTEWPKANGFSDLRLDWHEEARCFGFWFEGK